MNENIKEIQEKIDNALRELDNLYEKKNKIILSLPKPDLEGKYIHMSDETWDFYMGVNIVNFELQNREASAFGSSINIYHKKIGNKYILNSDDVIVLNDAYDIITEDEFKKVLSKALESF